MLELIPKYDKYFFEHNSKNLFGFTGEGLEQIHVKTVQDEIIKIFDFFIQDDIIYISREILENQGTEEEPDMKNVVHYYKQEKKIMTEITDFPLRPIQEQTKYESANWKIIYDKDISKVFNLFFKGSAVFRHVSGCYENIEGLYFNVLASEIMPGRSEGLYFFPKNRTSVTKIKEKGEIW